MPSSEKKSAIALFAINLLSSSLIFTYSFFRMFFIKYFRLRTEVTLFDILCSLVLIASSYSCQNVTYCYMHLFVLNMLLWLRFKIKQVYTLICKRYFSLLNSCKQREGKQEIFGIWFIAR